MSRLLFIEASPRGPSSISTALAGEFVEQLSSRGGVTVDRLDLWAKPLPELDGALLQAKYARLAGRAHDAAEIDAWRGVEAMVERLTHADAVVIASPLWNFGIPYKLKHYIDLVTQPGLTFRFTPCEGYTPLLRPRPVVAVLASSGDYRSGLSYGRQDLATPYLKAALAFIGLSDATVIGAGPTVGPAEAIADGLAEASARLQALAPGFLAAKVSEQGA
jgi:FMN-dependent NADH-azoreductase